LPAAGAVEPAQYLLHVSESHQSLLEGGGHHGSGLVVRSCPLCRVDDGTCHAGPGRLNVDQHVRGVQPGGPVYDDVRRDLFGLTPGRYQDVHAVVAVAAKSTGLGRVEAGEHSLITGGQDRNPLALGWCDRPVVRDEHRPVWLLPASGLDAIAHRPARQVLEGLRHGDHGFHRSSVVEVRLPVDGAVDN
jgi:hypothetical protein